MPDSNILVFFPSPQTFTVLNIFVVLVTAFYFIFMAQAIGGGVFSILFNAFYLRDDKVRDSFVARDVLQLSLGCVVRVFVLAFLPILLLMFFYSQLLYNTGARSTLIFTVVLILNLLGFAHLYYYRWSFKVGEALDSFPFVLGLFGVLILIAAQFIFVSALSFFHTPEMWPLVRTPVPLIFSANVVARFALYLNFMGVISGLGLFCYHVLWRDAFFQENLKQHGINIDEYKSFFRNLTLGTGVAAAVTLPVFMTWTVITLPVYATCTLINILYIIAGLSALLSTAAVIKILYEKGSMISKTAWTGFLVALFLIVINDQLARSHAMLESNRVLISKAEKLKVQLSDESGALGQEKPSIEVGKKIFQEKCMACHDFNKRIVGPPYKETVPVYMGDFKALAQFVQNPVKKRQDYPPMPNLGLTKNEAESAAMFLIEEIKK